MSSANRMEIEYSDLSEFCNNKAKNEPNLNFFERGLSKFPVKVKERLQSVYKFQLNKNLFSKRTTTISVINIKVTKFKINYS